MVCSYMVMAHVDSALQMLAIIKSLNVPRTSHVLKTLFSDLGS